jgi:hypothetical protein
VTTEGLVFGEVRVTTEGLLGAGAVVLGFLLIGLVFLFFARSQLREIERLRRYGRRAAGVVVDHRYDQDGAPFPVVQFQAPDGQVVTAHTRVGGAFAPGVGDQVTVLFDPDHPDEARIDSGMTSRVIPLVRIFALGWVVVFGIGIVVVLVLWFTVPH